MFVDYIRFNGFKPLTKNTNISFEYFYDLYRLFFYLPPMVMNENVDRAKKKYSRNQMRSFCFVLIFFVIYQQNRLESFRQTLLLKASKCFGQNFHHARELKELKLFYLILGTLGSKFSLIKRLFRNKNHKNRFQNVINFIMITAATKCRL